MISSGSDEEEEEADEDAFVPRGGAAKGRGRRAPVWDTDEE
jgi:hypothetical protein